MGVVRNTLILSAVVTTPAVLAPPILATQPNPGHVEKMERKSLSQLAYAGRGLFKQHCADCHGMRAEGTIAGPSLLHDVYKPRNLSRKDFHIAVTQGVAAQRWSFGDMPGNRRLSFNEIELIARYVREIQFPRRFQ